MSDVLDATLSARFPRGPHPDWVRTFKKAVAELELLLRKDQDRIAIEDGQDGDAAEEQDRGRGEGERASIDDAEANLRTASEQSHQKEPLPYIWLSSLYDRLERWTEAREAATKAMQLDPLSTALLIRLSNALEQEKNYVKALEYYERAVSILPVFERASHDSKVARLRELAEEQKANIVRLDPFSKLPHEVILSVMQYGLESPDRDFVIGCTWVCRQWRETLINSPTLWTTLTFDAEELNNKKSEEKRKSFIERSGKKIHAVNFQKLMVSSVDKIHKSDRQYCTTAKRLDVSVTSPLVLSRLSTKFHEAFSKLEYLRIDGGYVAQLLFANSHYRRGPPPRALHCDFIPDRDSVFLLNLELSNVDFRDEAAPVVPGTWDRSSTAGNRDQYSSLRSLTAEGCAFMNGYLPIHSTDRWQSDPLHRALRTTTVLETLTVVPEAKTSLSAQQPGIGRKTTLDHLRSAVLPPPSVWTVDIVAPNLQTLKFALPGGSLYDKHIFLSPHVWPLIPDIVHSPVPQDKLWKLTHVELECCDYDKIDRLEEWLSRLSNVKTLAIRGSSGPWPAVVGPNGDLDNRAQVKVLESLIQHPEWLNKLETLHLDVCYTPDQSLIDFVNARTVPAVPAACTPLKRITLRWCSKITEDTVQRLQGSLENFESLWSAPPPSSAVQVVAAEA